MVDKTTLKSIGELFAMPLGNPSSLEQPFDRLSAGLPFTGTSWGAIASDASFLSSMASEILGDMQATAGMVSGLPSVQGVAAIRQTEDIVARLQNLTAEWRRLADNVRNQVMGSEDRHTTVHW